MRIHPRRGEGEHRLMKIYFVSMGCAKNTADSEHLTAQLESLGHTITD
ncbi:MAG: hypothetical protein IJS28_06695, partial [Synergistaceae bacterium]|nr:hypothetical protein [Synergistaceae bacterium]